MEESEPARAISSGGGVERLDNDTRAVIVHGALSGGELALGAKLKVAPLQRESAMRVEGEERVPGRSLFTGKVTSEYNNCKT